MAKRKREMTARELQSMGGKALMASMTPQQRRESARRAALARWAGVPKRERSRIMSAVRRGGR